MKLNLKRKTKKRVITRERQRLGTAIEFKNIWALDFMRDTMYDGKLADRPDSQTVMGQLKAWFDNYNSYHSHGALGYLPPQLFPERGSAT
jgi:hypothetical protein